MNLETKMYFKVIWDKSKNIVFMTMLIVGLAVWLPIILYFTTDLFDSKTNEDVMEFLAFSIFVGFSGSIFGLNVISKLWEVLGNWHDNIKSEAKKRVRQAEEKEKAYRKAMGGDFIPRDTSETYHSMQALNNVKIYKPKAKKKKVKKNQKAKRKILVEAVKSSSVNRLDAIDIG